jgi:hypothetical protein
VLGKKFTYSPVRKVVWNVEVISETITHFYIRNINNGRRWNVPKSIFLRDFKEM